MNERERQIEEVRTGRPLQVERWEAGQRIQDETIAWLEDLGAPEIVSKVWSEISPVEPADPLEADLLTALLRGPGRA